MPLKYSAAPTIIDNNGRTDTPAIFREIRDVNRPTPVAKFASKFRSRRKPVEFQLAEEFEKAYLACRLTEGAIASFYDEALPFPPPKVDRQRDKTYRGLLAQLSATAELNAQE
jgi:hypothetical protein